MQQLELGHILDGNRLAADVCKAFPYVWAEWHTLIWTPWGVVSIPFGFLSDGATGVKDLVMLAWFCHDRLYLIPEATRNGKRVRLSRRECDLIYWWLLMQAGITAFRATGRYIGLAIINTLPWGPWRTYRRAERKAGRAAWAAHVTRCRILPHAASWRLPTNRTRDAIFIVA